MCLDSDAMYDSTIDALIENMVFSLNIEGVTKYHNDDITSHRLKIK